MIRDTLPLLLCFFGVGIITDYTTIAEVYWMRDVGYTVEQITYLTAVVNISWILRPFFGILVDRIQSLEISLILVSFLSGLVWLWLAVAVKDAPLSIFLLTMAEFGPAISLTIVDAMMVKFARITGNWTIPQWCQVARQIGKAGAGFMGSTQIGRGYRTIYIQQAILLCIFSNIILGSELRKGCRFPKPDVTTTAAIDGPPSPRKTTPTSPPGLSEDDRLQRSFTIYLFVSAILPTSAAAIFLFLSGPLQFPSTTFGLLELTDLISILGSCFTFASVSISTLSYVISLSVVTANILLLGVVSRQDVVDDSLILVLASVWITFITSSVHSRFTVETSKVSPKGNEAYFYALHSTIPGMGRFLNAFVTTAVTEYFHINHDNFEKLTLFHGTCSIFQSLSLFVAASM